MGREMSYKDTEMTNTFFLLGNIFLSALFTTHMFSITYYLTPDPWAPVIKNIGLS